MIIGHNILESKAIPLLKELPCSSLFFCIDSNAYQALPQSFKEFISDKSKLSIEIDSNKKSTQLLAEIWQWLAEEKANRRSTLVIIGGGTLSDVAGFAAATYMRGIKTINITTTLLGMVDASVGGKTAIDFNGVKNLIGAFHSPQEVIIDTSFLETLPIDELYSGFGEVIKTALLKGGDLWNTILNCNPQQMSSEDWLDIITTCITYKEDIVIQDPQEENGIRSVLNLGHTIGHAIETFSREASHGRALLHGEAIIIGLLTEGYLAVKHQGLDKNILRQLMILAREHYPYYQYVCNSYPRILELIQSDKKNSHNGIHFILLTRLGYTKTWVCVHDKDIEDALDFYREAFGN